MDSIDTKQANGDDFMDMLERIRSKAELLQPSTIEEITKEVEVMRTERYVSRKG